MIWLLVYKTRFANSHVNYRIRDKFHFLAGKAAGSDAKQNIPYFGEMVIIDQIAPSHAAFNLDCHQLGPRTRNASFYFTNDSFGIERC